MASIRLFRVPVRLATSTTARSFCRSHFSLRSSRAPSFPHRTPSSLSGLPLHLALSASVLTLIFIDGPSRSIHQLNSSSYSDTAADAALPLSIRLPSQRAVLVDASSPPATATALHLVGVGALRLSSDHSAPMALYQSPPHHGTPQSAVIVIKLSVSTPPHHVQRAVRQVMAPAVESTTGTEWDNIASCSQLDTALASLYLPASSQLSRSSLPPPSPDTHHTLPAGTAVLIELSGRLLRVWLNGNLACAIDSRMLNKAALASLAPLCTLER